MSLHCLFKSPMRTQAFCPFVFEDDFVIPPLMVTWVIASAHHANTVDWNYTALNLPRIRVPGLGMSETMSSSS